MRRSRVALSGLRRTSNTPFQRWIRPPRTKQRRLYNPSSRARRSAHSPYAVPALRPVPSGLAPLTHNVPGIPGVPEGGAADRRHARRLSRTVTFHCPRRQGVPRRGAPLRGMPLLSERSTRAAKISMPGHVPTPFDPSREAPWPATVVSPRIGARLERATGIVPHAGSRCLGVCCRLLSLLGREPSDVTRRVTRPD